MSRPFHFRKQALTLLLAIVTLPSALASLSPMTQEYCVWAWNEAASCVTFEGSEELDYYINLCSSELFMESFSCCIQSYCTEKEARSGLKLQHKVCVANAGINLPGLDQYTLPKNQLASVAEADEDLITKSTEVPQDFAVVFSRDWYETTYKTTVAYYKNRKLAFDFV
jgi:hypothetical protein